MKSLPTLRERWNQLKEKYDAVSGACYHFWVGDYNLYIDFTAQKLALWMFVPCNSKGEPMEKPEKYEQWKVGCDYSNVDSCKEYQKALDACIFEGWEWIKYSDTASMYDLKHKSTKGVIATKNKGNINFHYEGKTIEDLITAGIDLTLKPNHAKELGITNN